MPRQTQDALLTVSRALPAQNTNANSSSIDLVCALPEYVGEQAELVIAVPATTTATGQTITFTINDSATTARLPPCRSLRRLSLRAHPTRPLRPRAGFAFRPLFAGTSG